MNDSNYASSDPNSRGWIEYYREKLSKIEKMGSIHMLGEIKYFNGVRYRLDSIHDNHGHAKKLENKLKKKKWKVQIVKSEEGKEWGVYKRR